MPEYIYSPIEVDESSLQDQAMEYLTSRWPEWTPSEGHLETWQIMALARMVAEALFVGSDVPPAIFRYFGQNILGIPPVLATSSSTGSTWTLSDNPGGRLIEAGTYLTIDSDEGVPITFEVISDVEVAAGELVTGVGEVGLRSLETGSDFINGLGGIGTTADLIDEVTWVDSIALTGPTTGGTDAETDEAYLDRLSTRLTLLTPRPILARDFELLAVDIARQEGASIRAVAIDNYNPNDDTDDNEKMATLGVVNTDGTDVSTDVKTLVDTTLQEMREVNFILWVIDPTRTPVDVTYEIVVLPTYDPDEILAETDAAVAAVLASSAWGSLVDVDTGRWFLVDTVRRQMVSDAIRSVTGVSHWTTLTIGLDGGAQTTDEEFALDGAVPLTEPGDIVGTVA